MDELYSLFVGLSHRHYCEPFVTVSHDPMRFLPENIITTVFSHAPELIQIGEDWYISSCGIEDPQGLNRFGLYMTKLRWLAP